MAELAAVRPEVESKGPAVKDQATADASKPESAKDARGWGAARCTLFRFFAIYYVLYFLSFPASVVPGTEIIAAWWSTGEHAAVMWVGKSVLRLGDKIILQPTGSGDTMFEYVKALCFLVIALTGAAVWSLADRKRTAYPRLLMVCRMYVRLALAGVMLGYGLAKVFPMQFQPPGPDRLLQTYGNSSPMGLLWTFMGYSPAYTIFAGAMETIGAFLLLFRRTATLGGLFTAGVMLNVVMLNFCYDVPVKLYSTHLMLAALAVAMPDVPRLFRVLVLNREAGPAPRLRFQRTWMNWGLVAVEIGVMLLMVVPGVTAAAEMWQKNGPGAPKPSLYGLYDVETFELNGEVKPPLLTDPTRWRRFSVTKFGFVLIQNMTDAREAFALKHDETTNTVELTPRMAPQNAAGGSEPEKITLACSKPEEGKVLLEGPYRGGTVKAVLKKIPETGMPLMSRGFHWVQEFPYNR